LAENYTLNVQANLNGNLNKSVTTLNSNMTKLGNITKGIGRAFGIAFGVHQIARVGEDVVNTIKKLDSMRRALMAITDNQYEFAKASAFTARVAEDFGVELLGLTDSYVRFTAAVRGTSVQGKKAEEIFSSLAKSGAVLGLSTAEMNGVFRALSQMMSKGKVQAEELRLQLGDRLPGAVRIMAKALGVTTGKLEEMLKKGEVMSDVALPKFAKEYEKAIGADQIKRVETLTASQNRLSNSWTLFVKSVDEGEGVISKVFKGVTEGLSKGLKNFAGINPYLESLKSGAKSLSDLTKELEILEKKNPFSSMNLLGESKTTKEITLLKEAIASYVLESQKAAGTISRGGFIKQLGLVAENTAEKLGILGKLKERLKVLDDQVDKAPNEERIRAINNEIEEVENLIKRYEELGAAIKNMPQKKTEQKGELSATGQAFSDAMGKAPEFDVKDIKGIQSLEEYAKILEEMSEKAEAAGQKASDNFMKAGQHISFAITGMMSAIENAVASGDIGQAMGGLMVGLAKYAGQFYVQAGLQYFAASKMAESMAAIYATNPVTAPLAVGSLVQAGLFKSQGIKSIAMGVGLGAVGAIAGGLMQKGSSGFGSGGSGGGGGFMNTSGQSISGFPDKVYMYAEGDQLKAVMDLNGRNNQRRGK
jgi:tape measure domain-containing protein